MEKTTRNQLKIAIVGPESSGKSTLCKQLSRELNCDWVPEFARKHLTENSNYCQGDLDFMLKKQLLSEKNYKSSILICDTEAISFKVWSFYKYGSTSEYIIEQSLVVDYDFYLLLSPDITYKEDPLRENNDIAERLEIFELFENELKKAKQQYAIVKGQGEKRLENLIHVLQEQKIL